MSGSGTSCAVIGCHNNTKKLKVWKKSVCETHSPQLKEDCPCCKPYGLHRFPGRAVDDGIRKIWIKNIHRKDFAPNKYSTVCGVHFPDGRPTKKHPYPVLNMGYEYSKTPSCGGPPPKRRCLQPPTERPCDEPPVTHSATEVGHGLEDSLPQHQCDVGTPWPERSDHDYCSKKSTKDASTQTYPTSSLSVHDLDDKMSKVYTGLDIISFWQLFNTIIGFLPQSKTFELPVHDQLLLALMRLRLGLKFTDLGMRFGISRTTACDMFAMWRATLANFMRDKLIFWPPRDTLKRVRPSSFRDNYPNATCIIDCTEVFVQRPKNFGKRAKSYSNYKHHNTYKVLYCIAPNGFVMYVSKLFDGRASDTYITKHCGFLSHLISGDQILTDRGFTIGDDLPPGVKLAVPFTRGCIQLSEHEVTRTRRLAIVRIHVERACVTCKLH
ncbi:uncharacterized protein LOC134439634 isoform X2 [Engraulis encrasicolus]|uniref:uncharacterized protein LOC134439634 isoform X2 n=1 Tax=Engraulis encrasicolus TaxID=184585 RepID=UPI002FD42815